MLARSSSRVQLSPERVQENKRQQVEWTKEVRNPSKVEQKEMLESVTFVNTTAEASTHGAIGYPTGISFATELLKYLMQSG